MPLAIEITQVAVGSVSAILAIAFLIVTARTLFTGRSAYELNRSVSPRSLRKTALGEMKKNSSVPDRRTNKGLAFEIESGKLRPQERLSSEAIDDVIGRHF